MRAAHLIFAVCLAVGAAASPTVTEVTRWRLASGGGLTGLAASADGALLACRVTDAAARSDDHLAVVTVDNTEPVRRLAAGTPLGRPHWLGATGLVVAGAGELIDWPDARRGAPRRLRLAVQPDSLLAASADGQVLAVATGHRRLRLLSRREPLKDADIALPAEPLATGFTADGQRVWVACGQREAGRLLCFDTRTTATLAETWCRPPELAAAGPADNTLALAAAGRVTLRRLPDFQLAFGPFPLAVSTWSSQPALGLAAALAPDGLTLHLLAGSGSPGTSVRSLPADLPPAVDLALVGADRVAALRGDCLVLYALD